MKPPFILNMNETEQINKYVMSYASIKMSHCIDIDILFSRVNWHNISMQNENIQSSANHIFA